MTAGHFTNLQRATFDAYQERWSSSTVAMMFSSLSDNTLQQSLFTHKTIEFFGKMLGLLDTKAQKLRFCAEKRGCSRMLSAVPYINVYEHGTLINQFFDERLNQGARTTTNLAGF